MHVLPPIPVRPPAHVAHVSVPALRIDAPVREGVGSKVLARGAGHYADTGWPGQGRTIGLAAHNVTPVNGLDHGPFHFLQKARRGMRIIVRYGGRRYVYRITGQRIVRPTQVNFLRMRRERLVLTNCYPDHSTAFRLVTFAIPYRKDRP